jgi:hypothetical protein
MWTSVDVNRLGGVMGHYGQELEDYESVFLD